MKKNIFIKPCTLPVSAGLCRGRKMKTHWLLTLLLISIVSLGFSACNDTDDGSYTEPISQYEKIGGQWLLNSVTQVDETTGKTMTLTSEFDFDTFVINLNKDEKNQPTTFTVDGTAPQLLPQSGTWRLENPYVNSDGSSAKIILNDKVQLTVTAVPGAAQTLEFKLTRKVNGKPFVSYIYNLIPITE